MQHMIFEQQSFALKGIAGWIGQTGMGCEAQMEVSFDFGDAFMVIWENVWVVKIICKCI